MFKNYNELYTGKQAAVKKGDLESIKSALRNTQQEAGLWKGARRNEMESALIRIERMANSVEIENLTTDVAKLRENIRGINWAKPNLRSLYDISSQIDKLRKQLYDELIKKLKNEDSILIIEEPEIIEDLGKKKNWNFERFIAALEVVLRNGLIEIKAAEEK